MKRSTAFTNRTFKKKLLFFALVLSIVAGCHQNKNEQKYTFSTSGYYYRLLAFNSDSFYYREGDIARLGASFKTQSDSVFWDSYNNMNDFFFIEIDSSGRDNLLRKCVSESEVLDSVCILVKTKDFFEQQFKMQEIPFFSKHDSVVKIDFKVKKIMDKAEFSKMNQDLEKKEMRQIQAFFGSAGAFEKAKDPSGFYWVDKPETSDLPPVKPGQQITVNYIGYFLNGRFLEKSPADFELIYGTPDQLIKGINYVIGRINFGQSVKIILPSRLAFGEKGSSNGTVPPYTPLIYQIKLNNL